MFRLEFKTGNAAFDEFPQYEVIRILREQADRIEADALYPGFKRGVLDANGNRIGTVEYVEED
jgi:hypothetical protein